MTKRFDARDLDKVPDETWEKAGISKEQFKKIQTFMQEREKRAPTVGGAAPDFEIKRLSANGKLTEETIRLSSLLGKPVALIFGSYT
jgi:hypothetical protein